MCQKQWQVVHNTTVFVECFLRDKNVLKRSHALVHVIVSASHEVGTILSPIWPMRKLGQIG